MAEIIPGNPNGDVKLVTSLKLYVTDMTGARTEIGTAVNLNPSERRPVTYNFVIGNNPPDEARDLIPGPVNDSTLSLDFVCLYTKSVIKALGDANGNAFLVSIREQNRPIDIEEVWRNPATGDTRTIRYVGCYFNSYSSRRDISSGDIRVMESVSLTYRTIQSV